MIRDNEMMLRETSKIDFNPVEVGEVEYGWWRAHNDKDYPKVIEFLALQFSKQYGLSPEKAKRAIEPFVHAVEYHDQGNWERAAETLAGVYEAIQKNTQLSLDPKVVAKKEVYWWRLHDELEDQEDKTPLIEAFMDLYSAIYGVDRELLRDAAEQRTLATVEHDKAEQEGVTPEEAEGHWDNVKQHLVAFYTQLKRVVEANI